MKHNSKSNSINIQSLEELMFHTPATVNNVTIVP